MVAIVVLNHNGRHHLLDCLQHIGRIPYRPLETLVVDNASSDGSVEAVRHQYPNVQIVQNAANLGVAGGRNTGVCWVLEKLPAEFILFLDNDTTVEPDAVLELVAAASADPRIGMVSPKAFRHQGDRHLLSAGGMHFNPYTGALNDVASGQIDSGQHDASRDVQACPGFAFLVRRSVFGQVGLFDETFNPYGWEDVDFSLRAARAGYRIRYAPKAVVYHAGGRVGRGIVDLYERHKCRNLLTFVRRHTTRTQWVCFLTLLPFRALGRVARELFTGNGRVVRAWLAGYRGKEPHR
jgi:hypothetical protein